MDEQKKEQQVVMIPVKEYRKLIRKIERLKIELADETESSTKRFKWWKEEEARANALEQELTEAREVIKGYKESAMDKLGLNEEVETLAELQFEKGVSSAE
jgi:hypothetical protein